MTSLRPTPPLLTVPDTNVGREPVSLGCPGGAVRQSQGEMGLEKFRALLRQGIGGGVIGPKTLTVEIVNVQSFCLGNPQ